MAEFTKQGNYPQPGSYVGLSREADKPQADKTLGTLFAGLGNTLEGVVNVVDNENKAQIDNALYKGVDEIRGQQGVDAAVKVANNTTQPLQIMPEGNNPAGPSPTPSQINKTTSEVERLSQARASGAISDTLYWAKVESLVREVRARYPGYREEIDQKVSKITGTTPANALRAALSSDYESAQKRLQSEQDKFDTFVKQNFEHMSPGLRDKWIKGERGGTFQQEVYSEVSASQSDTAAVTRERARIGLANDKKTLQQDDAVGALTTEANQFVNKTFNQAASTATGGASLMASINKLIASGKGATPEEQQQLRSAFALYKSQISTGLEAIINNPLTPNSSNSYNSVIRDSSKVKGIKEAALARVNDMEQLLINGEYGLFAANAQYAKASEDATTRQLLENSESARKLQAARNIFRENLGVYLTTPEGTKVLKDTSIAINNLSFTESVTGTGGSGNDQLKRMKTSGEKDPAAYRDYLTKHARALADPKVPAEALVNLNENFYGSANGNFLSNFQPGNRGQVYAQLTSPEITKNMVKLKADNPKAWQQYQNWAATNFYALNKQTIDTVAQDPLKDIGVSIAVDANGKLRVIDSNPSGGPQMKGGFRDMLPGDAMVRGPRIKAVQDQIDIFNRGVDSLTPILKEDGLKPVDALGAVYRQMGVPVEGKDSGNADKPTEETTSGSAGEIDFGNEDMIDLNDKGDLINLDAQSAKRSRALAKGVQSDPNWEQAGGTIVAGADVANAIRAGAAELGTTPEDLATAISYETGGTFDPSIRGGAGNRHIGLIQFGTNEQAMYGANQQQTVAEQMRAVVKYLKHRGFKPGMDMLDLYSTINAGSPGRYNASDAGNGGAPGSVRDKVNNQMAQHRRKAIRLLSQ